MNWSYPIGLLMLISGLLAFPFFLLMLLFYYWSSVHAQADPRNISHVFVPLFLFVTLSLGGISLMRGAQSWLIVACVLALAGTIYAIMRQLTPLSLGTVVLVSAILAMFALIQVIVGRGPNS